MTGTRSNMEGLSTKVAAGSVSAAVVAIGVWTFSETTGLDVPALVQSSAVVVVGFLGGVIMPELRRFTTKGKREA
ncbi:hypothetical protein [Rathayibacter sp. AY1A7]|uniref:hypothetical protein n=1 Tax=Rathayibacter sp. AY1A7 TaxID=2080524 RepID=UPI000CE86A6E|nr:hypothetical protein [Rathayibacter sp. AY1A7]PPF21036.1 hypothetical protein C5B95_06395 [Rathayibacter sp. AY1A7]